MDLILVPLHLPVQRGEYSHYHHVSLYTFISSFPVIVVIRYMLSLHTLYNPVFISRKVMTLEVSNMIEMSKI